MTLMFLRHFYGGVNLVKTAEKHINKKMELVEIAEKMFLVKGYEETSVDDILKASGLSKGGFYHYFKSKEEVLTESIGNFAENLLKELEPIMDDLGLNALEKLNKFMEIKIASQKQNQEIIKYFVMLMKSDFMLFKYCEIIVQKYIEPFARIIEQGVKEGIFKVEFPIETADILLRAVTSIPQSIFFIEYLEDKSKSLKYKSSMEAIMAKTLGIDIKEIRIF